MAGNDPEIHSAQLADLEKQICGVVVPWSPYRIVSVTCDIAPMHGRNLIASPPDIDLSWIKILKVFWHKFLQDCSWKLAKSSEWISRTFWSLSLDISRVRESNAWGSTKIVDQVGYGSFHDQCSGSQRVRQGIFKNIYLTNIFYVAVRLFGNLITQDTWNAVNRLTHRSNG